MTDAQIDARALPLMNRMNEIGVPRCEVTEEVVARCCIHPHSRIYVHKTEDKMTILVKTWEE